VKYLTASTLSSIYSTAKGLLKKVNPYATRVETASESSASDTDNLSVYSDAVSQNASASNSLKEPAVEVETDSDSQLELKGSYL
jgi:hypothetical protein